MRNSDLDLIRDLEFWLSNSNIRIKEGEDCGGFFGWQNLEYSDESNRYPFIYNEIIGYSLSCFSFLYSESNKPSYIDYMRQTIEYLKKNITNGLFNTGKRRDLNFTQKGSIENQIYCFDNGIILAGLLNYYKITQDQQAKDMAIMLANTLTKNFFSNAKIQHALLDSNLSQINYGSDKWSTRIGSYHAKIAIGFIDLYNVTNNKYYLEICDNLCEFALSLQNTDGSFTNNLDYNDQIYLHPHLYTCEGLLYVGSIKNDKKILLAGLKGVEWAISNITMSGGAPRSNMNKIDQADCTSQLFRLLLIYRKLLTSELGLAINTIESSIDSLHKRVVSFSLKEEKAIKYNDLSNSACTWCTMFALQALIIWKNGDRPYTLSKIKYFV